VRVVVFVRSERRVVAGQHGRPLTDAVGGREGGRCDLPTGREETPHA
jgi:hypothetical protein